MLGMAVLRILAGIVLAIQIATAATVGAKVADTKNHGTCHIARAHSKNPPQSDCVDGFGELKSTWHTQRCGDRTFWSVIRVRRKLACP